MIKTILGLVDEIEGEIIFQRKEDYAYIPEHPTYYDELTLWEHIELVRAVHGIEDADYEERVHTLLDIFRLEHAKHDYPGSFSKGMQQKLMIIIGGR